MRDILFRGKRKDNGEWVYGYYVELPIPNIGATIFANAEEIVCEDTAPYIIEISSKQHSNYSNANPIEVIEGEIYEVIPETVGQYTGAKDKNGDKIFEGDIVRHVQQFLHGTVDSVGVVAWSEGYGAWIISKYSNNRADMFLMTECHRTEIIGNIHDNPELLEETKND